MKNFNTNEENKKNMKKRDSLIDNRLSSLYDRPSLRIDFDRTDRESYVVGLRSDKRSKVLNKMRYSNQEQQPLDQQIQNQIQEQHPINLQTQNLIFLEMTREEKNQ